MTKAFDNEMKIEFLSKSNNEAFARIAVAAFIAQLDPTIEEISDIKTAVSEAVTNSIIHGYEGKVGIVKLVCKIVQNEVFIEISDTGKGIKEEDLPHIWDRYYKNSKKHKRNAVGTGIGLSIVKNILINHQLEYGDISKKGKGSTFYFEATKK